MTERFYSSERGDVLAVRDGSGPKRPLHNRFDYRAYMTDRAASARRARLAFDLLADALDEQAPSGEVHDYFVRRIMPLLPERFTISRSRVLAYVERIAEERLAQIGPAEPSKRG